MTITAKHPATFSEPILATIAILVPAFSHVLDPFAGVGKVHELSCVPGVRTVGVEIEREWAMHHPRTLVGNALNLPFRNDAFDVIVTSPCYGNRMADHHNAQEKCRACKNGVVYTAGGIDICSKCKGWGYRDHKRITYTHTLGRQLHDDNSGKMQWGPAYRDFHERAWKEVTRVLKPAGLFILNVSDHIRAGVVQPVTHWQLKTLWSLGLTTRELIPVQTRRMKQGANAHLRVDHETVAVLTKGFE